MSMEQFQADPRVRPFAPMPACQVAACTRTADGAGGYCNTHYQRWRTAQHTTAELDHRWWQVRESGVAEPGQVNLRAVPALVVVAVGLGIQQRVRGGAKITDVDLRVLCDAMRRQLVTSIEAGEVELVLTRPVRSLRGAVTRHVRRALADPGSEQAKDVWDLAIFGHRGNLSFTGIAQPWLATPPSGGRPSSCRGTAAAVPPGSEATVRVYACRRRSPAPQKTASPAARAGWVRQALPGHRGRRHGIQRQRRRHPEVSQTGQHRFLRLGRAQHPIAGPARDQERVHHPRCQRRRVQAFAV
jgi:hypothetical protein